MLPFKLTLSKAKMESLQKALSRSEKLGDYPKIKKILLKVSHAHGCQAVSH